MPRTGIAQRLYEEKVSGAKRDRPELVRMHARAYDLIQAMHHPAGVTRIADADASSDAASNLASRRRVTASSFSRP